MTAVKTPPIQVLVGIPAAPGFAQGPAVVWAEVEMDVPRYAISDPAAELDRLAAARDQARQELAALQAKVHQEASSAEAAVFNAHLMFLDDRALLKKAQRTIEGGLNAETGWMESIEFFAAQLASLPDPTLSARSADVRDVGQRVLRHLSGRHSPLTQLTAPAIIVAEDLTPSQTASLDKSMVLAFCTVAGAPTSHTAILAKALGIPAIVALGPGLLSITAGATLLVDGNLGEVVVNPDPQRRATFQAKSGRSNQRNQQALSAAAESAITQDGVRLEVVANIGGIEDAKSALAHGAEGVGLFRTEFLFLDRTSMPTETEQIQAYHQVFDILSGLPVVVRSLDIGGDKAVSYIGFPEEANPFLGWRAIRMNEGRPDVFQSQVRALLQAAPGADLRLMVPMVSNLDEILLARRLLDETRQDLLQSGLPCAEHIQFGIMVEIPSAALLADRLAPHVDFFSIGTNDLTQYTLAVDRTNALVAPLASPYHPAVLRLIQMTIQAAHGQGKWVGVCGELAGEILAAPLLLGLGLDEFSMAPALIPALKRALRLCSQADCRLLAEQALTLASAGEVRSLLTAYAARLDL